MPRYAPHCASIADAEPADAGEPAALSKPPRAKTVATRKTNAKAAKPSAMKTARRAGTGTQAAAPRPDAAPAKPHKQRPALVRDGFTMPESDFALIGLLKKRLLAKGCEARKSEVLRAGLHSLAALEDAALVALIGQLCRSRPAARARGIEMDRRQCGRTGATEPRRSGR